MVYSLANVTVNLPSLLVPVAGVARIDIQAETVAEALDNLFDLHPGLKVHLFDESSRCREHVLCFVNDTSTRWMDSLNVALSNGDEITILQAVSGG